MNFLNSKPKLGVTPITFLQKTIEWIASALSMIYFSTPLIQIIRMYKEKLNVEKLPITLIITILFNCTFWILHGITESSSKKEIWYSLLICNCYGLLINIAILFLYLYLFLEKNIKKFIGYGLFVVNLLIEVSYLMEVWVINKKSDSNDLIGFVATVINILMYLSPATNIFKLWTTGEYEFLPIITNMVGFFTILLWLIYGILTYDSYNESAKLTLYSNCFSILIVSIQIAFWIYYFLKSGEKKKAVEFKNIDDPLIKNFENE